MPEPAKDPEVGALFLVAQIREAIGDNGKLMQDELLAYCRELAREHAELPDLITIAHMHGAEWAKDRIRALETALAWVRNTLLEEGCPDHPMHSHAVRGRWDDTGKTCEECAQWKKIWSLVKLVPDNSANTNQGTQPG